MKVGIHRQCNANNMSLSLQVCKQQQIASGNTFLNCLISGIILKTVAMKGGMHTKYNAINMLLQVQDCKQQQIASGNTFLNWQISAIYLSMNCGCHMTINKKRKETSK